MGLRWFIADLLTGRDIADVQVMTSSTWSRSINKPERLTASLDMRDPATVALRPRQTMAPGRTVLACAIGDTILAGGPIWSHTYDRDQKVLTLDALGMWSYFDHRYVLPLAAASIDTTQFIIPDPSAAGKTKPNPAVGTYLTGLEYGTIAKRWVQQAQAWTGGNVPIVFEADRVGTRERNFEGSDFKNLGTVLAQLSQIEGGPDIRFMPQFTPDMLGIQWALQTGTDASPLLASATVFEWPMDVPRSPVSSLKVTADATRLATLGWATAGRSADTVLVSRSVDSTLTDLGYAAFESLDSSHSSVSEQGTLDGYAGESTTIGRSALELWSFDVEAARQPFLGAYWEGDFCTLTLGQYGKTTYTPWVNAVRTNYDINPSPMASTAGWSPTAPSTLTPTLAGAQIDFSSAATSIPTMYSTTVISAAAGQMWSAAREISVPVGFPAVTVSLRVFSYGENVIVADSGPVVIQPGQDVIVQAPSVRAVGASTTGVRSNLYVTAAAGSRLVVPHTLTELAPTPGMIFDGNSSSSDVEQYAWTATPNASPSTYSTRTMQQYDSGDPYLFEGGAFQRRITALSGDAKGITVGVTTQAVI
ncbi:hypothetical protein [Microbacterium sp. MYb64]|uniref:hypothetical protein n=1 Tax=Microbacterium sp. MYb64 TaxID=1848691 RepID=UPI000CFC4DB7|nr:hypothetical protein [Microbacterium sp. MYb64]PRB01745.1 hypothetical protein CQ044_16475 [Microbacterium sp. MYb64]